MYTPSYFKIDDSQVIIDFIQKNSFGLVLSVNKDGGIDDTHTPFAVSKDGKYLLGHIAKANGQWKSWEENTKVKVVFRGEHAYISPNYYESEFAVPTWNYMAVSISGQVLIKQETEEKLIFLDQLIAANEPSAEPWKMDKSDERYIELLSGIVVFSVSIDSVEASFKLSQNRSLEDQNKVITSLTNTGCPFDKKVASTMSSKIENL